MENSNITFKGLKDALIIMLNNHQNFDELMEELEKKLETSVNFLKGINYPIKVAGRDLSPEEFEQMAKKIKDIVGLDLTQMDSKTEEKIMHRETNEADLRAYFYGIDEGMTKFYRGTLRSGQLLKFHGNIVVIGDANPGSEIVASGNIVVLGTLRGIVHAGYTGNKDAVVVAFNLQPTQLRIADVITRPPEEKVIKALMPEIAFVKDETVYIEYYLPNK